MIFDENDSDSDTPSTTHQQPRPSTHGPVLTAPLSIRYIPVGPIRLMQIAILASHQSRTHLINPSPSLIQLVISHIKPHVLDKIARDTESKDKCVADILLSEKFSCAFIIQPLDRHHSVLVKQRQPQQHRETEDYISKDGFTIQYKRYVVHGKRLALYIEPPLPVMNAATATTSKKPKAVVLTALGVLTESMKESGFKFSKASKLFDMRSG